VAGLDRDDDAVERVRQRAERDRQGAFALAQADPHDAGVLPISASAATMKSAIELGGPAGDHRSGRGGRQ
jgi:hypothetical protein